jgi:hypothetical protein
MRLHRQRQTETGASALRAGPPWAYFGGSARSGDAPETPLDARELGLRAIAAAFAEGAGAPSEGDLLEALLARRDEIDVATAVYALRCIVGLTARQTDRTPRTILDEEFVKSPSDDYWRARI